MIFNGIGYISTQAIIQGVIPAHGALKFGKLANHVGQQISLGQLGGLICLPGQVKATELFANGRRDGSHTLHTLTLGAQLVVIHNLA